MYFRTPDDDNNQKAKRLNSNVLEDDGEDDASHEAHVKVMEKELRKSEPNEDVILNRMTFTSKQRMKWIMAEKATLNMVVERYPAYNSNFMPRVVIGDFTNIIPEQLNLREVCKSNMKLFQSLATQVGKHVSYTCFFYDMFYCVSNFSQ